MTMEVYILHAFDESHRGLRKVGRSDVKISEFIDITDLFSSGVLRINYINSNFPVTEGDPNEGLSEISTYLFTVPKRLPINKLTFMARNIYDYALKKKKNIEKMFNVKLDFNSVGIFSEKVPSEKLKVIPEREEWMLNLKCINLEGNLNRLYDFGVEKYGNEDFS